ncbi:alpha/beta hydrolase [Aquipuribacter sp. MA13-6]|uniref:alpha/beta hydrolase n=1 Tax=unclassified Aquipuribacter TaxID=2635084 RepID=UPI003EE82818
MLVATAVTATLLLPGPTATAQPPVAPPAPEPSAGAAPIEWGECDIPDLVPEPEPGEEPVDVVPEGYECALHPVPLDHSDPSAGTIELALIKRPADEPDDTLGSVFVNPGGPSGSGFEFVLFAGEAILPPAVNARYDVIGFDPRGIARSAGLDCATGLEGQFGYYPFFWPETRADLRPVLRANALVERDCDRDGGPVRDHMSTTAVADDLDLMRRALGEDELNFIGFSYGSYLGAMYAARYPDRVGALVVDAVIDPVDWATGRDGDRRPTSARLDSDVGAQATLEEFFRLCDEVGTQRCAFAGDSAARYAVLHDQLAADPLVIPDPDFGDFVIDEQLLVGLSLGPLYNSVFGFTDLGLVLQLVEDLATGVPLAEAGTAGDRARLRQETVPVPDYVGAWAQFSGVICADGVTPDRIGAWQAASDRSVGYFGPYWTWSDGACEAWQVPQDDVYLGPFDAETSNPVLILNTRYDPATDVSGAFALRDELPSSRLVLVEGWGHTALGLSLCADAITTQYFLTSQVPPQDVVCEQDAPVFVPFEVPEEPAPDEPELGALQDEATEARVQQAEETLDDDVAELVRRRALVLEHVGTGPAVTPRP